MRKTRSRRVVARTPFPGGPWLVGVRIVPYPPHHQRRVPTTRETVSAEFARADGNCETQASYAKVTGSTPGADIDAQVIHRKVELSCGCYWPDVEVGGVCAECTREGAGPNVCKDHYAVCICGAPCCWKHSRPMDDQAARLCSRCSLREKNKALKATVMDTLGRAARRIFLK